jgi:signal transduction histidine kinase/ligand-binding sensor domain-containing protein
MRRLCIVRLGLASPLVLALASATAAQDDPLTESWRWVHFTTASGLPSNRVFNIIETPDGTVWAATQAGLAWFDGYAWHAIPKSDGLPEAKLNAVVPDGSNGLLVVAENRLYRGGRNGFRLLSVALDGQGQPVANVARLDDGRLLTLVGGGRLFAWQDGALLPFPVPSDAQPTSSLGIWSADGRGVWTCTVAGVYRWERDRWALRVPTARSPFVIRAVSEDGRGEGLISFQAPAAERGLWTWTADGHPGLDPRLPRESVESLDLAPNGDAIAVYETGAVWSRRAGRWSAVEPLPAELRSVLFVKFRENGDLWVGSETGLHLLRRSSERWTYWDRGTRDSRTRINEILRTHDGSIWIGREEGIEIHWPNGRVEEIDRVLGTPLRVITGLAEDVGGHVWVSSGSAFEGAFRYDGRAWRHVGAREGLGPGRFHRITRDRQGRLWFLGISPGLPHELPPPRNEPGAFVYAGGRFSHWGTAKGLPNARVYTVAQTADEALWFGTSGGLSRWKAGTWTHWTKSRGLRLDRVFTVAVDQDDRVWFGDQNSGLGVVEADTIRYLTSVDGLVSDSVWDLDIDARGTLWIATRAGLSRYADDTWATFDARSGLKNTRVWPVLAAGDRVYAGTAGNGTAILDLTEAGTRPPKVVLTTPMVQYGSAHVHWNAFAYWGEVEPDEVETRSRLDGGAWTGWSTARERLFTDLSPGAHTIHVQAKNLFGRVDTTGQIVSFTVQPPLIRQPLFYLPVGFLSLAVVGLTVAYAARKLKQDRLQRLAEEERLKLEAEMLQAQKLESLGVLAGGIAHNFNNLLTAIVGYTELALSNLPPDSLARGDLREVDAAARRATELTRQMLTYAGKHLFVARPVQLAEVIGGVTKLLEASAMMTGAPSYDLAPDLPAVRGDVAQLRQILVNLVVNASEAIGDSGGTIVVRTGVKNCDAEYLSGCELGAEVTPGEYVCLEVADTGCGMTEDVRRRIFDPFFTTKFTGRGLGLAAVYGIVRGHGGGIRVESEPGRGTTITVLLPVWRETAA